MYKLSNGLLPINYGFSFSHQHIGDSENVGDNGENLTIVLLSCNRSVLTIKLLDSLQKHIPGFKGEVILFDNASHQAELRKLEKYSTAIPFRFKLIKSDKNYGVAGGRNRAFAEVNTDWIMSLDNDIYFISNPLEICKRNIACLGCKFLNLPLLDDDSLTPTCDLKIKTYLIFSKLQSVRFNYGGLRLFSSFSDWFV